MTATPLIVTADDYGLTDGTSRAIIEAHRGGVVTATSVLAVVPGVSDRLAWLVDVPDLSVGVHLAAVGEDPPVLTAREVPTLVDEHGRFRASWRQLLPALAAGRVDAEDLRREFEAQVALVSGIIGTPSHLDTHQHVHLWPSVGRLVVDLAQRHGIGAVRVPAPSRHGARSVAISLLTKRLRRRVGAAGLASTDRFRGLDEAGGWSAARLEAAIEELGRGQGSVEINLHPGPETDPDRHPYAWGYRWGEELAAAQSASVAAAVRRCGFELVGR